MGVTVWMVGARLRISIASPSDYPGIVTNVLLQAVFLLRALKNVIFAMKCLKVPRTHKILDPAPRPMTP